MTNCLHWARWSPRDEELELRVAPRCAGDDEVAAYFEVIDQSGHVLADEFKVAVSAGRIGGSAGESWFVSELSDSTSPRTASSWNAGYANAVRRFAV